MLSDDEAAEAECVRRLHGTGEDLVAAMTYMYQIADARRAVIRRLFVEYGWSYRGVAKELGISEQAVSKLMKKQSLPKKGLDERRGNYAHPEPGDC